MSKKEHAFSADPDRLEDDPSMVDQPGGRKLSWEMKIGLGVILVLLVVLSVILANRLRGSSESTPTAQNSPPAKSDDTSEKKPASESSTASTGAPTVVNATSQTNPASGSTAGAGPWISASGLAPPSNGSVSGLPTYMPKSSGSAWDAQSTTGGANTAAGDNAGLASTGDSQPHDPFHHKSPRPSRNGGSSSISINTLPDTLNPPDPASSSASALKTDPQIGLPDEPPPSSGVSAPTAGPYGSDRSGRDHGRHRGSMYDSSSNGSFYNTPYSDSPYGSSPQASRGTGGDRQPSRFGPASGGVSSNPSGPDYSALPPTLEAPPALKTSPGPTSTRPSTRAGGTTYQIQPNDSYWTISQKVYGIGAYYQALAEHNRKMFPEPDKLQVGATISTPGVEELTAKYPNLCPKPDHVAALESRSRTAGSSRHYGGGRTYTVREGDNLFDIAKYELGKASRWVEIYELNRDALGTSFNYLTPGMQLALPEKR